jgi:DNA (cytosine-5)-methyltransferase 1
VNYLSVCSGIEAASVAWQPLGWKASVFAEIEAFPSAVLAHHYPSVPNRGDITQFQTWPDATFSLLVGGTPCQSFSVAGLRAGLADPRGNLALTYLAIADRYRPEWLVWENVPGVLSADAGRALGAFLGGLGQLGYGWAYRVLDAQYFGLAQRRKRLFVVGHLGDWRRAAAVLFERASLSGHPPPSRETGQTALTIPSRSTAGGGLGTDFDCDGGLITGTLTGGESAGGHGRFLSADGAAQGFLVPSTGDVSHCLNAGGMGRIDYESETLIAHSLRADGFDASEDGTGRGTPLVSIQCNGTNIGLDLPCLRKGDGGLTSGVPAIAFSVKDHGADAGELAPTLRAGGHHRSHANGGVMPAVAFDWQSGGDSRGLDPKDTAQLQRCQVPAVMFQGGAQQDQVLTPDGCAPTLAHSSCTHGGHHQPKVMRGMQVRRLTPRECERLQGFPDDYTLIPYRGQLAKDGPRYKALGNSMAVPVMRWIGQRIKEVESIMKEVEAS